jgi:hypothetical protein
MRREIVATRRAGVTTSVIKRITPKGMQCACICIKCMTATLNSEKLEQREKLEHKLQNKQKLAKISHLLEHVPKTRYGNRYHIGCWSQLVKTIQK